MTCEREIFLREYAAGRVFVVAASPFRGGGLEMFLFEYVRWEGEGSDPYALDRSSRCVRVSDAELVRAKYQLYGGASLFVRTMPLGDGAFGSLEEIRLAWAASAGRPQPYLFRSWPGAMESAMTLWRLERAAVGDMAYVRLPPAVKERMRELRRSPEMLAAADPERFWP